MEIYAGHTEIRESFASEGYKIKKGMHEIE
jgi:hypothetical protein